MDLQTSFLLVLWLTKDEHVTQTRPIRILTWDFIYETWGENQLSSFFCIHYIMIASCCHCYTSLLFPLPNASKRKWGHHARCQKTKEMSCSLFQYLESLAPASPQWVSQIYLLVIYLVLSFAWTSLNLVSVTCTWKSKQVESLTRFLSCAMIYEISLFCKVCTSVLCRWKYPWEHFLHWRRKVSDTTQGVEGVTLHWILCWASGSTVVGNSTTISVVRGGPCCTMN